jgi:hypothetical protein
MNTKTILAAALVCERIGTACSAQQSDEELAEGPSGAPEWGLRFTITPLFPTAGKSASAHDGKSFAK